MQGLITVSFTLHLFSFNEVKHFMTINTSKIYQKSWSVTEFFFETALCKWAGKASLDKGTTCFRAYSAVVKPVFFRLESPFAWWSSNLSHSYLAPSIYEKKPEISFRNLFWAPKFDWCFHRLDNTGRLSISVQYESMHSSQCFYLNHNFLQVFRC